MLRGDLRQALDGTRWAMSVWTIIGRLTLSFLLGGLIGWEREHEEKPAGLRTFILVSLGAALFVLATLEAVEEARGLDQIVLCV
jgi:putative Mg2+ transporter-C (MgtC) family protein